MMTHRIEAYVQPQMLRWARETSGRSVDEVAKRWQLQPKDLEAWESGTKRPSMPQARNLAGYYHRPLSSFYLHEPPEEPRPLRDFRRLPGSPDPIDTPALLLEERRAGFRREAALDLSEEIGEPPQAFTASASVDDQHDAVADKVRKLIGISLADQQSWKNEHKALNAWRSAIEVLGVLVFQSSRVGLEEMRGFSLHATQFPVIVVNPQDPPKGRIFSLIHEFVHLLLREGGICLFRESDAVEVFCNQVAAEVLVPTKALLAEKSVHDAVTSEWSEDDLGTLSRRYWVSQEVVLRRLLTLGKTTEGYYAQKRAEWAARPRKKAEGGPKTEIRTVKSLGEPFIRLVLEAYSQEKITLSDVVEYIPVNLRHLDPIRDLVLGPQS